MCDEISEFIMPILAKVETLVKYQVHYNTYHALNECKLLIKDILNLMSNIKDNEEIRKQYDKALLDAIYSLLEIKEERELDLKSCLKPQHEENSLAKRRKLWFVEHQKAEHKFNINPAFRSENSSKSVNSSPGKTKEFEMDDNHVYDDSEFEFTSDSSEMFDNVTLTFENEIQNAKPTQSTDDDDDDDDIVLSCIALPPNLTKEEVSFILKQVNG